MRILKPELKNRTIENIISNNKLFNTKSQTHSAIYSSPSVLNFSRSVYDILVRMTISHI